MERADRSPDELGAEQTGRSGSAHVSMPDSPEVDWSTLWLVSCSAVLGSEQPAGVRDERDQQDSSFYSSEP